MASTLQDFLASQENLLQEASEAIPHQFNQCTYPLGSLRQSVYLCVTCNIPRGICAACSTACHTDHEQLELFPKRDFRCDCPTTALSHPCNLHQRLEDENTSNQYGQNFRGLFCRCGRPYDATNEIETMIQCLACEDWFHESCCNLRERPEEPALESQVESSTKEPETNTQAAVSTNEPDANTQAEPPQPSDSEPAPDIDDGASEASSSGLPPPLIRASDYESFICASCVQKIPVVRRYAGTEGCLAVIRSSTTDPWRVSRPTESSSSSIDVISSTPDALPIGSKRPLSPPNDQERETKRPRTTCLAPPPNNVVQQILSNPGELGAGDVFLTEGFRQRWCRCSDCLPSLEAHPFLLNEEDTYEPPEDPESGLSLEELGMRALNKIPRERAIEGIHAFNAMRDNLMKYLRPFAEEGKIVGDDDVKAFFEHLKGQEAPGR